MTGSLNQSEKVLSSFRKNEKEEVRLSEVIYQDHTYIDIRIFAKRADGVIVPTPKGLTISKTLARYLNEALTKTATQDFAQKSLFIK